MNEKLLIEAAEELKNITGNVKGDVPRTYAEFIKYKEGEIGLKKVEEKMKELGMPIFFDSVNPLEWINAGKVSLIILVAKEIFGWEEKDIFEMGRSNSKISFFWKMMIQYLISTEKIFQKASEYWKKHFDFGEVEPVEINKKEKRAVVRVKGYKTHPLHCVLQAGHIRGVADLTIKSKDIKVEETKCVHRGSPYNEFKITWK